MTMDCEADRVHWMLYRDAAYLEKVPVLSGSLPLDQVRISQPQTTQDSRNSVSNSTYFTLDSTGIQLAPELQQRVWDLFKLQRTDKAQGSEGTMDTSDEVFPVSVEDLTLDSRAAELGLDGLTTLYCKLQLGYAESKAAERQKVDWFSWKLKRASEYRVRGNDAFKQESYDAAVRLYKRALNWLEPPASRSDTTLDAKIQYSAEELQQVNAIAVASYANMATCYSKLNGDGDVDRCIAAASSALELDD
ncbi:Peptidyl-prolyl cis-trans isomerase FKBP4, partial [Phytophthora palmivora]